MSFEDFDNDNISDEEEQFFDDLGEGGGLPGEENNRTFLIVAGGLGALILLTIICIGAFAAMKIIPQQQDARKTQVAAESTRQQEIIQQSLTETAGVPTITLFPPTYTPTTALTKTPVLPASYTPTGEEAGPATQTVIALQTQLAAAQTENAPTNTPSAVPTTGFADEVGAPGLLGLAIVLMLVIFLARRLRSG